MNLNHQKLDTLC